jgi:uncharacterized protein YciW
MKKCLTELLLDDAQAHVSERGIDARAHLDARLHRISDSTRQLAEDAKSRFDDHRRTVRDR